MKILHVISSAKAEGTPKLVQSWLEEGEHKQFVIILNPEGELLSDFEQSKNTFVNRDFIPSIKSARKIAKLVKQVCKTVNPDVVIAWPTGHSQWIHLGAFLAGVRKKITHIGNPPGEQFFGRYIATAMTFWVSIFFNVKFVACSKFVRDEYHKIRIFPQRVAAIYNSLDLSRFSFGETSSAQNVSMIGYMEPVRDHYTLIRAWKNIVSEVEGELQLVGEGSLKSTLEKQVATEGIPKIHFLGRLKQVDEVLKSTRVYVLSTLKEGFGITLLEAMASGCRIVATDVPAVREVLDNGRLGQLVPIGDTELLGQAIVSEMRKGELSGEERSFRQNYLEQFSVGTMMDNYLKVVS